MGAANYQNIQSPDALPAFPEAGSRKHLCGEASHATTPAHSSPRSLIWAVEGGGRRQEVTENVQSPFICSHAETAPTIAAAITVTTFILRRSRQA